MPYVTGKTLTVGEFQGSSGSNLMWTTKAFMEAWNSLRLKWGNPIYVGYEKRATYCGNRLNVLREKIKKLKAQYVLYSDMNI